MLLEVFAVADLELRSFEEHAEGVLDESAHRGDAANIVEAGADDLLRMGQNHSLHAAFLSLLEHKPGLADMKMATGQRQIVFGDDVEYLLDLVPHLLVRVQDRDRRRRADLL